MEHRTGLCYAAQYGDPDLSHSLLAAAACPGPLDKPDYTSDEVMQRDGKCVSNPSIREETHGLQLGSFRKIDAAAFPLLNQQQRLIISFRNMHLHLKHSGWEWLIIRLTSRIAAALVIKARSLHSMSSSASFESAWTAGG